MLGAVAGNIIGSPFQYLEAESPSFDFFQNESGMYRGKAVSSFPRVGYPAVLTVAVVSWLSRDSSRDPRILRRFLMDEAARHSPSMFPASFRYWMTSGRPSTHPGTGAVLPAAILSPLGLYIDDLKDALDLTGRCTSVICSSQDAKTCSQALVQAVWMARHGRSKDDMRFEIAHDYDLNLDIDKDELSSRLIGEGSRGIAIEEMDGSTHVSMGSAASTCIAKDMVSAALISFLESGSFGNSVSNAVMFRGRSDVIASMAGAVAAPFHGGVPESIASMCGTFLPPDLLTRMESLERSLGKKIQAPIGSTLNTDLVRVIKVNGRNAAFVVSPGRNDIVRAIRSRFGEASAIIKPSAMRAAMSTLCPPTPGGTYLEEPRPEVKFLYCRGGAFMSPSTYDGPGLADLPSRQQAQRSFLEICEHARSVRRELQLSCGYSGPGDIHFESAFYPVVMSQKVEIRQGDLLVGEVSIDPRSGLLSISVDGDLREGEYRDADWCREKIFSDLPFADATTIKERISRFCLDDGVGIGDLSRRSNIETAIEDLSRSQDERLSCGYPVKAPRKSLTR